MNKPSPDEAARTHAKIQLLGLNDLAQQTSGTWLAQREPPSEVVINSVKQELLNTRPPAFEESHPGRSHRFGRRLALRGGLSVLAVSAMGSAIGGRLYASKSVSQKNREYSTDLSLHALQLFCEDAMLLNDFALRSVTQLPNQPSWGLNDLDWRYLQACSLAAQATSSTRQAHWRLANEYLRRCQQVLPNHAPEQSEVALIFHLSRGIVYHAIAQYFGKFRTFEIPFAKLTKDAAQSLQAAQRLLDTIDLPSESKNLINAALLTELGRFTHRLNDIPRRSQTARAFLAKAKTTLDSVKRRDQQWWTQYYRWVNNIVLIETREITKGGNSPTPEEISSIKRRADQINVAPPTDLSNESPFVNSRHFERGIAFGNTADVYLALDDPSQFVDQAIACRVAAIRELDAIPLAARTSRFYENLGLNIANLIVARCIKALDEDQFAARESDIRQLAVRLQAIAGTGVETQVAQIRPSALIIGKLLLQQFPPSEAQATLDALNYPPRYVRSYNRIIDHFATR